MPTADFLSILNPPEITHKNAELVDLSGHSRVRRAHVLAFIKANPDTTRGKLIDKLGYGYADIDNDLSTMRRNALIVSSGKNPTKWRVMT